MIGTSVPPLTGLPPSRLSDEEGETRLLLVEEKARAIRIHRAHIHASFVWIEVVLEMSLARLQTLR